MKENTPPLPSNYPSPSPSPSFSLSPSVPPSTSFSPLTLPSLSSSFSPLSSPKTPYQREHKSIPTLSHPLIPFHLAHPLPVPLQLASSFFLPYRSLCLPLPLSLSAGMSISLPVI